MCSIIRHQADAESVATSSMLVGQDRYSVESRMAEVRTRGPWRRENGLLLMTLFLCMSDTRKSVCCLSGEPTAGSKPVRFVVSPRS